MQGGGKASAGKCIRNKMMFWWSPVPEQRRYSLSAMKKKEEELQASQAALEANSGFSMQPEFLEQYAPKKRPARKYTLLINRQCPGNS